MCLGSGIEFAAGLSELAGCHGKPRNECDVVLRAIVHDIFVLPVAEVVLILHADDVDYFAGLIDLVRFDFAQSNVANLSLLLQLFDCA